MLCKATVVDYGVGNLLSVCRALEYNGANVTITDSAEGILHAERLVLPGVGAFSDAMSVLRSSGLVESIQLFAKTERPFLGICLGMQMMMDESEEFGKHDGLGLIPGIVVKIPPLDIGGVPLKVPHIGWNTLRFPIRRDRDWWQNSILHELPEKASVYFVHSFAAQPTSPDHCLADTYYGGRLLSAVIRRGNIYGCQFHPEKSGPVGLSIIGNFLTL